METVTFSSQFIEIFDHLCQKFGVVIDWSAQNVIPDITALCGRMTSYVIFKNVVLIFVFAGIFYLFWRFTNPCCSKENKWDPDFQYCKSMNGSYVLGWVGRGVVTAFSFGVSITALLTIIKCIYLPEFVIIDCLSSYL